MYSSPIKEAFTGGSYKRTRNRVVLSAVFELSTMEARAIRNGRRGCSLDHQQLTRLRERCCMTAQNVGAKSWSIYPVPNSHLGHPKAVVEFHNWPEMGMCNFQTPIAHKRYWWDWRPVPEWINPQDGAAVADDTRGKGNFDNDA